jgi:hypothetical protein
MTLTHEDERALQKYYDELERREMKSGCYFFVNVKKEKGIK